jgi:cyclic-di-AMP phosphodiesterase PgpH
MDDIAERQIYDDAEAQYFGPEITLVDARNSRSTTLLAMPQSRLMPRSQIAEKLRERLTQLNNWSPPQQIALSEAIGAIIQPNVRYNADATAQTLEMATAQVEPAFIALKRNQVIAREGDTVTGWTLSQLKALQSQTKGRRTVSHIFGLLFIVSGLYWMTWQFVRRRAAAITLPLSSKRAFTLVGLSILVQTVLIRVGFLLSESLNLYVWRAWMDGYELWSLAIPFASGALLVALLLDTQLGFITGLMAALFAAMLAPKGGALSLGLYTMLSCAAAIYGIKRYRERQSVTLAGLVAGAGNGLTAIALMAYNQQPLVLKTILLAFGCGLLGGLLTIIFTSGGLPINESLFGVLTDVKLLELSNADLPILSQIALHAPGTNQHSHGVGQLTEEACRAIGANALLARIGALYHDIGKLGSPLHFIENQNGDNPHDRLKPSQSAKIIVNHVNYGLKLAEDIGLPKQIAAFIPQHHGTRTLHYFYRKALEQVQPGESLSENEFRYPGPKPQFKESAIMMIADSCEAAARSLSHPTPECLGDIVDKIVKAIQEDGQLDECGLTMRELKLIRDSIVNSLIAIYHTRVTYPGFNPPDDNTDRDIPANLDAEERGLDLVIAKQLAAGKAAQG